MYVEVCSSYCASCFGGVVCIGGVMAEKKWKSKQNRRSNTEVNNSNRR